MFVQTKTPRSWLSHLFSSQLRGVFGFSIVGVGLALAATPAHQAIAATKQNSKTKSVNSARPVPVEGEDQGYLTDDSFYPTPTPTPTPKLLASPTPAQNFTELPRDKNSPIDVASYRLPPSGKTDWKEFFRNLHGSYNLSFMGPRIAGSGNETYNIFIPDVAPVQLSHTWQLGFQVNPDVQLGFSENAIQNVADGVTGKTGVVRGRTWEAYDPEIYVNLPNLIQVPGWFVFTSASMSVPLTEYSKTRGKISQVTLSQSWSYSKLNSDWSFGVNTQIQPIFYTDPMPGFLTYRRTLYTSFGHLISYRINPILNIQWTSTLDFDYRSPNPANGPTVVDQLKWTSNLDDTSRLAFYLSPALSSTIFLSIGGYFQFLLWEPTMETSIVGLDFTISF